LGNEVERSPALRTLVVEDDRAVRDVLTEVLELRGHPVTAVGDAESGLAAWEAAPFPLVLLDWMLPGMDGPELCRRLRESHAGDAAHVLMVTSRSERDALAEALRAGANDYLAKPFDIDDLDVRLYVAEQHVIDLARRKDLEAALEYQALHDGLTALPNRTLLRDRLGQAIGLARRGHGTLALLLIDLDRFKDVNDTLGHAGGDEILQQVAGRLQAVLRASDTVARLGGDEFAVVLPQVDEAGAEATAQKLRQAFAERFVVADRHLTIGASVGVAVWPIDGEDMDTLLQAADTAMYQHKRGSRSVTY
jgi:diguanylate cyclase (GGDEF)-like protein